MRFSAFLLLLLIRVDPIWSQEDLLACVDPDVRIGLLRSIPMGTAVTPTVPDPVTELGDLGDFEFIASIVEPVGARTAFKTALSASETTQRMTAMLQETGWHNEHRGDDQGGGFVVERPTQTHPQCGILEKRERTLARGEHAVRWRQDSAVEENAMTDELIDRNPEILGGTAVFTGTRVPVRVLMEHLEAGDRLDEFLDDFPSVTREQAVWLLERASAMVVSDSIETAA